MGFTVQTVIENQIWAKKSDLLCICLQSEPSSIKENDTQQEDHNSYILYYISLQVLGWIDMKRTMDNGYGPASTCFSYWTSAGEPTGRTVNGRYGSCNWKNCYSTNDFKVLAVFLEDHFSLFTLIRKRWEKSLLAMAPTASFKTPEYALCETK